MPHTYEYRRWVTYHSYAWQEMVEQGWVTIYTEGTQALMLWDGRAR